MPSRSSTASGLLFGSLHIAAHGGPRGGGEASGIVKCLVGIRQGLDATAFRDPASEPRAS